MQILFLLPPLETIANCHKQANLVTMHFDTSDARLLPKQIVRLTAGTSAIEDQGKHCDPIELRETIDSSV